MKYSGTSDKTFELDSELEFGLVRRGNTKYLFSNTKQIKKMVELFAGKKLTEMFKRYKLLKILYDDLPTNCDHTELGFTFEYDVDKHEVYFGQTKVDDGSIQRMGRGILIKHNKFIHEGFWYLNQEHGFGRLLLAESGMACIGGFKDGYPSGICIYEITKFSNHKEDERFVQKCTYAEGIAQGQGVRLWRDGLRYEGKIVDDKLQGKQSKFIFTNGDVYTGKVKEGRIHGEGVKVFADGRTYKGMFKNGVMEDTKGVMTVKDSEGKIKETYTGDFSNNQKHGKGIRGVPGYDDELVQYNNGVQVDLDSDNDEPNHSKKHKASSKGSGKTEAGSR